MRYLILSLILCVASLSAFAQKDMKAAVMAANQQFMDAFAKGATTMSTMYTADAQLLPPNSEAVKGGADIGAFWKGGYDSGLKRVKLETIEADQSGDQILEVGRYTLFGDKDAELDKGKYIVIWKRQGGQWKLYRDIWNTSAPAAK